MMTTTENNFHNIKQYYINDIISFFMTEMLKISEAFCKKKKKKKLHIAVTRKNDLHLLFDNRKH